MSTAGLATSKSSFNLTNIIRQIIGCRRHASVQNPGAFIVSNIKKHIANGSIFADCQHSSRSQRSCETQTGPLCPRYRQPCAINHRQKKQNKKNGLFFITDLAMALVKVPHITLFYKLELESHGIKRSTHKWNSSWLSVHSTCSFKRAKV